MYLCMYVCMYVCMSVAELGRGMGLVIVTVKLIFDFQMSPGIGTQSQF